jgi:lysozyme
MAAPQITDIKKPTRERVKEKDDKKTASDKKATNDKKTANDKKATNTTNDKKEEKPATTLKAPVKVEDTKPADVKPDASKSPNDTANKPVEAPKPKVRTTTNPAKVDFDGIDVSKHQGTINWEELKKNTKIKFVYIKSTEGSDYVDPRYQENIRNARKHGFKVGSYHFLSTRSSAVTQFQNFLRTAKREEQDLLPIIDVEKLSPWTAQQLRDSLKVFADLVEDYYGCKPLIYTSEKFFTKNLGRAFSDYPLFIAKYNTSAPEIGYKWILWQFADNGLFKTAVKGNYGEVDLSRFNKGCSINDIIYVPSKHKPKRPSALESVDRKNAPEAVKMTEQKPKEAPKTTKRQQDDKKQAEKEKKLKERNQKAADELAKKKADEAKKAKEKEEQRKKAEQQKKAREEAAKKAEAEKQRKKAEAKQARQDKAKREAASKSNKPASLMQKSASKLSQSQRNDSIRNANLKGRKSNKSSADND